MECLSIGFLKVVTTNIRETNGAQLRKRWGHKYNWELILYYKKCLQKWQQLTRKNICIVINHKCGYLWWALDKHKVPIKYVGLIKDMYNNVVTSVRTSDGDTDDFPIRIGLHQGSALSPFLFALVMDEFTRDIQGDIPWCMLFTDDVVIVDESRT